LLDGLNTIWPSRLSLGGIPLGDVWPCPILKTSSPEIFEGDDLVPFHKLTMWLTYSLVEVLDRILNWHISGVEYMTGLPEYRNGRPNISIPTITLLKKKNGSRWTVGWPWRFDSEARRSSSKFNIRSAPCDTFSSSHCWMEGDDCNRIVRTSSNVIESIGEKSRILTSAIWSMS
jgi:hypothetical protein